MQGEDYREHRACIILLASARGEQEDFSSSGARNVGYIL